uniref:SFRICE_001512 n=1 Tax=Spodoptera frugiperda TaxID=7108 RepID=A0A2H1WA25_SPOFR
MLDCLSVNNAKTAERILMKFCLQTGYELTLDVTFSGGIRTHASEETGALNQRLRPLGHATT